MMAFSAMPKWGKSVSAITPNGQSKVSIFPEPAKDTFMSLMSLLLIYKEQIASSK
jgi:hypothetical protein